MGNTDKSSNETFTFSGNKFALIVGVNNSTHAYLPSLKYAERDADAITQVLKRPECNFTVLEPPLLGREAQTMAVKTALIKLTRKRTSQDFLLFYFSGHAKLMNTSEGYEDVYFVTHDFKEEEIEASSDIHLSMRWLWKVLYQQTKAGKVLLILDCCYSGNIVEVRPDPYQIDLRKLVDDYLDDQRAKERQDRLRLILMATRDDANAIEKDGHGFMTQLLLPVLRGDVDEALDEEGRVELVSLFSHLKKMMQVQSPHLAIEFVGTDVTCTLAHYPSKSRNIHRKTKEAEEAELKTMMLKLSDQVDKIIIDPSYFERRAEISYTQTFDHSVCDKASFADLDSKQVTEFFEKELVQMQPDFLSNISDEHRLSRFGWFRDSHPTYGCLLCFGQNPSNSLSGAYTRCIYWRGKDRLNRWLESLEFRGNLLSQFESCHIFLQKNLRFGRIFNREGSTEQWEIPFRALEEALANALIHREYAHRTDFMHRTEPVQVEVFADRVEISSPEGPPEPMTLEMLGEENESHLRNPQIARIFYLCGHVERVGSGIPRIQNYMKEADLPPPRFRLSKTKTFTIILDRPQHFSEEAVSLEQFNIFLSQISESIQADPYISNVQILDMSRPLKVIDIYVPVRIHQETSPRYELEPALIEAEAFHDFSALLQVNQKQLEERVSGALDINEAIRTFRNCVIVGNPGSGKTTLLKHLALKLPERHGQPCLPIYIELYAFAISGYSDLLDFVSTAWEKRYGIAKASIHAYMEYALKEGKAMLLLDALDEAVIGDTVDKAEIIYKHTIEAITQAATRYINSSIVVTTRKAGYYQHIRLTGFTELELLDFRLEDIKQFVNQWFSVSSKPQLRASAADLNSKLEHNSRIQALAANPLLLSLIIRVYENQLDLPDRRNELYKIGVETLLTGWDASRDIRRRRTFTLGFELELLKEVAWHFHIQGRCYFPEDELLTVIANFLSGVDLLAEQNGQILAEITVENGLLKEQARGWYSFLHITLQEYFVAQYVVSHDQLDMLLTCRGAPWWEEVTLLYAGCGVDSSPLLRKLLGKDDISPLREDIFYTNLILAGQCLAARPTIRQVSLREDIISRLFDIMMKSPYLLTQEQTANILIEIGGTEVNNRLLQVLSNDQVDKTLRERLGKSLNKLDKLPILPNLAEQQFDRTDYRLETLPSSLNRVDEQVSVPQLIQQISDATGIDRSARERIALTLGHLVSDEEAILSLTRLLETSDISDAIHRTLWIISRRVGVRIFITNESANKQVEFVKWWHYE